MKLCVASASLETEVMYKLEIVRYPQEDCRSVKEESMDFLFFLQLF